MHCQNCFEAVPENAKVCGQCGTKLDKKAMFPCPSCGEQVPVVAKVCGYCGTKFTEAVIASKDEKQTAAKPKPTEQASQAVGSEKTEKKKKSPAITAEAKKQTNKPTANRKKAEVSEKKDKPKGKIPTWIFAVAAVAVAVSAYFLFFQKSPSTDCLNGNWAGQVYNDGEKIFKIYFDITKTCLNNAYCGEFSIPLFSARGRIKIIDNKGSKFYFLAEPNVGKSEAETPKEYLECKKDGTLFYHSVQNQGAHVQSGTLYKD